MWYWINKQSRIFIVITFILFIITVYLIAIENDYFFITLILATIVHILNHLAFDYVSKNPKDL